MKRTASEVIRNLEMRIARLENKQASDVSSKGEAVIKAMKAFEEALLERPSFAMADEKYYADIKKRFYDLQKQVEKEVKYIKGAY